jgi:phospholipase C
MSHNYEQLLTPGKNILGNTIKVVELVLKNNKSFDELFECYKSEDPWVRLRVSSCVKRICKVKPNLVYAKITDLLNWVSNINQPSTQWTMAQLFLILEHKLTDSERTAAINIMQTNLTHSKDWIVLAQTMQTLASWAKKDVELKTWLLPRLHKLTKDERKSVAGKAKKLEAELIKLL